VSEEDKPRVYRSVDVFCAPGLGGESFGIVLIEAMAAGTPVVCSDLPGFGDAVGDAALTVAPGDPGLLAAALDEVLTGEVTARRLREKGIARAGSFDWNRLVANVERVYERAA
jgi:phosphatidylinositol alpha-mannosyltransferase